MIIIGLACSLNQIFLKTFITNEKLSTFEEYKNDYDELGGTGIFD